MDLQCIQHSLGDPETTSHSIVDALEEPRSPFYVVTTDILWPRANYGLSRFDGFSVCPEAGAQLFQELSGKPLPEAGTPIVYMYDVVANWDESGVVGINAGEVVVMAWSMFEERFPIGKIHLELQKDVGLGISTGDVGFRHDPADYRDPGTSGDRTKVQDPRVANLLGDPYFGVTRSSAGPIIVTDRSKQNGDPEAGF